MQSNCDVANPIEATLAREWLGGSAKMGEIRPKFSPLGQQVILNLYQCANEHLDDIGWVRATRVTAAERAQTTIVEVVFHKFSPYGISGVVVIAESHLAVHIWPEQRYDAIDIFTCGATLAMRAAADYLIDAVQSTDPSAREFCRGQARPKKSSGGPVFPTTYGHNLRSRS